ncbi:ankyrin repeat domain-containing protein [uncultured Legionella sp.]|uniref:ankyrin repeat domain-containing protein n=1 Tax=uncultured Legionella sp. TaxID=210934 RepID=UPI0026191472|nr:ankyrin repeat domain-containing protein [uncultured Legionella sp.]
MNISFQELVRTHSLSANYNDESMLIRLKNWCQTHVSADCVYKGEPEGQYLQYMKLAQHYLDVFLPSALDNLSIPVSLFNEMGTLQYAAYSGYDRFIEQLQVSYSDEFDAANEYGMTCLHFAAVHGYVHTMDALLKLGAIPNKPNKNNQYPLHSTLEIPLYFDDESILIQSKISCFKRLKTRYLPAFYAQDANGETIAHRLTENGFEPLLAELMEKDTDLIYQCNNYTRYPIHTALLNNRIKAIELLLTLPAVSLLKDAEGKVALHYAAEYCDLDVVTLCCQSITDLNINDNLLRTPLMLAAEVGDEPVVLFLLESGADSKSKDYGGLMARDYAQKQGYDDIVSILK